MDSKHYYSELALAYVRGRCLDLADAAPAQLLRAAEQRGLRLHRFKRNAALPRVRRVLGVLKGFAPATLLDVGSGRGVFLWPLLDELPGLDVTALDVLAHRVDDINAVGRGGVERVRAECADAAAIRFPDGSFDAVTALEVLEHVADPAAVAGQVVRVARVVAIASVPAKEDDNPEHLRVFSRESITALFLGAGARDVRVEHVLNHMVVVVQP